MTNQTEKLGQDRRTKKTDDNQLKVYKHDTHTYMYVGMNQ